MTGAVTIPQSLAPEAFGREKPTMPVDQLPTIYLPK
jgi:hypothetical protein